MNSIDVFFIFNESLIVSLFKGVYAWINRVSNALHIESLAQNRYFWKMSSVSERTKLF